MTIKNAAGTQNPDLVYGRYTAVGIQIDTEGRPISAKTYTVAINVQDVSSIMSVNENFKDWTSTFTDKFGNTITGRFENPMYNQNLGYVHSSLTTKASTENPLA